MVQWSITETLEESQKPQLEFWASCMPSEEFLSISEVGALAYPTEVS